MEYLKIKNWDKWQTYRADRGQPPWIKIHRRLMRDPEWVSLSDAERGQLVGIWLLAADRDGVIPASTALIQKLSFMESEPNINKFIELGFICQNGVSVASERRQCDQPKAEAKAEKKRIEKKRIEHPDWLNLDLWKEFKKYRTQIKSPLTDHAEKLCISDLRKVMDKGHIQDDIINQTIMSGKWKSFYPVKQKFIEPGRVQPKEYVLEIPDNLPTPAEQRENIAKLKGLLSGVGKGE